VIDPKTVVDRFTLEFLGRGDASAADATLHPEVRAITGLKPSGPIEGRDEYKAVLAAFGAAFHDVEPLRIVDRFAAGERVATRFQVRLRHAADFFGVAATNRVILFDETHVARVRDGLIVENVVSATNLEFEMLMAPVLAPLILDAAAAREAGR
jgi:predicted ester cyclase